jgi:hypothetical protein
MSRYPTVVYEAVPLDGETKDEAKSRRWRNRLSREQAEAWRSTRCRCGMAQSNIVHNVNPEDQIEGPAYYADKSLHEFEPIRD